MGNQNWVGGQALSLGCHSLIKTKSALNKNSLSWFKDCQWHNAFHNALAAV